MGFSDKGTRETLVNRIEESFLRQHGREGTDYLDSKCFAVTRQILVRPRSLSKSARKSTKKALLAAAADAGEGQGVGGGATPRKRVPAKPQTAINTHPGEGLIDNGMFDAAKNTPGIYCTSCTTVVKGDLHAITVHCKVR
jgi:hypothetical protein